MSSIGSIVADTIAAQVFARWGGGRDETLGVDGPIPLHRYFAHKALYDAESMAVIAEALRERCEPVAVVEGDDPIVAASLRDAAQIAWTHYCYAREAAARIDADPVFAARAKRLVSRAHRAALALRRAAARAVTRAAIRARAAARARLTPPARRPLARRLVGPLSRRRAPARRRVRVSAVASAGSTRRDGDPEPSHARDGGRRRVGRRP